MLSMILLLLLWLGRYSTHRLHQWDTWSALFLYSGPMRLEGDSIFQPSVGVSPRSLSRLSLRAVQGGGPQLLPARISKMGRMRLARSRLAGEDGDGISSSSTSAVSSSLRRRRSSKPTGWREYVTFENVCAIAAPLITILIPIWVRPRCHPCGPHAPMLPANILATRPLKPGQPMLPFTHVCLCVCLYAAVRHDPRGAGGQLGGAQVHRPRGGLRCLPRTRQGRAVCVFFLGGGKQDRGKQSPVFIEAS